MILIRLFLLVSIIPFLKYGFPRKVKPLHEIELDRFVASVNLIFDSSSI